MIAQQVAAAANRQCVDVRALLLDPVDLRGIPWRDGADRTRWAPPAFLPPSDDTGRWLINLEELPSAVPMVQAASVPARPRPASVGEYELPEGASLIACGNRETGPRRRAPHADAPQQSASSISRSGSTAEDWLAWGAANGVAPEVLFFITYEPDLLHLFDPQSKERAFPTPRSWEFASNIVKRRNGLDPAAERALFPRHRRRGGGGRVRRVPEGLARAAASEGRPQRPRERRHPRQRERAGWPFAARSTSLASDVTLDAIVTFATRLRREVGESLVGACVAP